MSTTEASPSTSSIPPPVSQTESDDTALEGWQFLLESGQKHDQQRIENWKDELDNLLVFAGLFSAVLTAFVIESYQSLQPGSASTTDQLLYQISVHLSSFTITPGFVNATSPMPPTSSISPNFELDPTDVKINLLWFLSLTLSLVAAFFTIAAQQWLRSLSLPRQLSVSNAVRLQQCHRRNVSFYQISNIITLLPVLLQIAVVLFLVGLYFFLNELNGRITIAYSVVVLFPFVLYAMSLSLPLLQPGCPFKSPFVPSTAFVLRSLKFLAYILAMVFFTLPGILLARLVTALLVRCGETTNNCMHQHWQHVRWRLFAAASRFVLHMRNLYASLFKQTGDYWPNLELQYLRSTEKADQDRDFADALSAAPSFIPGTELKKLRKCYAALPPTQRVRCALKWAAMHLGYSGEDDISESGRWTLINEKFVTTVNEYLDIGFKKLLLQSLPEDLTKKDRNQELPEDLTKKDWIQEVPDITRVFIMLNQLVNLHDIELRDQFIPILLTACEQQNVELKGFWVNERIRGMNLPTVCLFQCSLEHAGKADVFRFDDSETTRLLKLASRRVEDFLAVHRFFELEYTTVNLHDIVLGSYAVALFALSQRPGALSDNDGQNIASSDLRAAATHALDAFRRYINQKGEGIRFAGQVALHDANGRLIVTPSAVKCIADSLRELSSRGAMQTQCEAITQALRDVCYDEEAFKEARQAFAAPQGAPCTVQPEPGPGLPEIRRGSSRESSDIKTLHPKEDSDASGRQRSNWTGVYAQHRSSFK